MVIAGIPCTMPAIWIGLIVIFLIVEGLTAGLVTIWFAVGALAALIAAMFHAPLWLQLVWFFAVSIAAFAVTRPLVKKYINSRTPAHECRYAHRAGMPRHGGYRQPGRPRRRVRRRKSLDRRAQTDAPIPAGTAAIVLRIEGVKLIVTPACVTAGAKE